MVGIAKVCTDDRSDRRVAKLIAFYQAAPRRRGGSLSNVLPLATRFLLAFVQS